VKPARWRTSRWTDALLGCTRDSWQGAEDSSASHTTRAACSHSHGWKRATVNADGVGALQGGLRPGAWFCRRVWVTERNLLPLRRAGRGAATLWGVLAVLERGASCHPRTGQYAQKCTGHTCKGHTHVGHRACERKAAGVVCPLPLQTPSASSRSLSLSRTHSHQRTSVRVGERRANVPWADATSVPPTRASALTKLRDGPKLDLLVVGGGATGCGVALDAATRGLRVGLVEQADFAAGTSSRSTKLVHGGVRYLEKAVFQVCGERERGWRERERERESANERERDAPALHWPHTHPPLTSLTHSPALILHSVFGCQARVSTLPQSARDEERGEEERLQSTFTLTGPPPVQADINQLKLVFEALHERKTLLQNATHLSGLLPTLTPCYQLWEVPPLSPTRFQPTPTSGMT
jgi:hypothetical protein